MNDIASKAYWDKNWQSAGLPKRLHPWRNPVEGKLSDFMTRWVPKGGEFLEIGCAASAWMPFFSERMGCHLWGVDYSESGLELARKNLELLGHTNAKLVLGDFVSLDLPKNSFRSIFSRGVIEHYQDPTPIFRKAYELLEPGGVKITMIPNMAGIAGSIQKRVDRSVFDVHVPYRAEDLDRFQTSVGLEPVVAGRPLGFFHLGVVNWKSTFDGLPYLPSRLLAYSIQTTDRLVGWATRWAGRVLDTEAMAPYFISVYRKPK